MSNKKTMNVSHLGYLALVVVGLWGKASLGALHNSWLWQQEKAESLYTILLGYFLVANPMVYLALGAFVAGVAYVLLPIVLSNHQRKWLRRLVAVVLALYGIMTLLFLTNLVDVPSFLEEALWLRAHWVTVICLIVGAMLGIGTYEKLTGEGRYYGTSLDAKR